MLRSFFLVPRYSCCILIIKGQLISKGNFDVNPIPTGLGHVTLIYGLISPMAGRNRVKQPKISTIKQMPLFFSFNLFLGTKSDILKKFRCCFCRFEDTKIPFRN